VDNRLDSVSDESPAAAERSENVLTLSGQARVRSQTPFWRRFIRHRLALIGFVALITLTVAAIFAPVLTRYEPVSIDLSASHQSPSSEHWLGTDATGRDVFSRIIYAGRVSLLVGIAAVAINVAIGVALGAVAGYFGGVVDSVVMRFTDVILSFPSLIIIMTVVAALGASVLNIILVLGLLNWPAIARLLRGELLSLREREFILAAKAIGVPSGQVIVRHLLPNAVATVIVAATFGVANVILLEAGLSFLGLGVQPPTPSWGNMLNDAQSVTVLSSMPWLWIPAGAMIAITVLSINFIGDSLRDALDPRQLR
jgi:peptide/nickel transport system permease protein